jgi:SNF2 family DNA or RNA helicase
MLVKEPVEYPESENDEASNGRLLYESESKRSALPLTPFPQKTVLLCSLPGEARHLKWRLTKILPGHLDIIDTYSEMGNDQWTKMGLKFQDLPNPSVFVTTPRVGGTGLNLTAANHVVITQKFWVLNALWQAFAQVV